MTNYPKLEVLYEDKYLIAVNKPAGVIIQGDKTGDTPLIEQVRAYIKKRDLRKGEVFIGLPHRLDRPTSGVVLMTKKRGALKDINKMFHDSKVRKTYWAVVVGNPPRKKATITHFLIKNKEQNKSYAYDYPKKGAKEATLTYTVVGQYKKFTLLEIYLHTGRHHQIRAQLQRIGCKIVGDMKYGYPHPNKDGSIHLHARRLSFFHPYTSEKITIFARPPRDEIWDYFYSKYKNRK